jgi:D-hexose-6-phosphate mutarotase
MKTNLLEKFLIPDQLEIVSGNGSLPKIVVTSQFSAAEIYLHGAHVTHFQKSGEPPLLFLSGQSFFESGKPIRGGVPICFPWFGSRENFPAHGFARLANWELIATATLPDGGVKIYFQLPANVANANEFAGKVHFVVTVGETLTMELLVENNSTAELVFEECLHTYFSVANIQEVSVVGLNGKTYLDKVGGVFEKRETADAIRFDSEVDRVYLNAPDAVEIRDENLHRKIVVEKSGSHSTVVWNPWIAKSKAMADFGDDEFKRMVCVESGNVDENKISLSPGKTSTLKVVLSSQAT